MYEVKIAAYFIQTIEVMAPDEEQAGEWAKDVFKQNRPDIGEYQDSEIFEINGG